LALGASAARLRPQTLHGLTRQGRRDLEKLIRRLDPDRQSRRLIDGRARLDDLASRLARAAEMELSTRRDQLASLARMHQTLGYTETLARGYAVVRSGDALVTTRAAAESHAALEIEFADGRLGVAPTDAIPKTPPRRAPPKPDKPDQGSLF
jgi:exodeoxyribonuclease VII large subunit